MHLNVNNLIVMWALLPPFSAHTQSSGAGRLFCCVDGVWFNYTARSRVGSYLPFRSVPCRAELLLVMPAMCTQLTYRQQRQRVGRFVIIVTHLSYLLLAMVFCLPLAWLVCCWLGWFLLVDLLVALINVQTGAECAYSRTKLKWSEHGTGIVMAMVATKRTTSATNHG